MDNFSKIEYEIVNEFTYGQYQGDCFHFLLRCIDNAIPYQRVSELFDKGCLIISSEVKNQQGLCTPKLLDGILKNVCVLPLCILNSISVNFARFDNHYSTGRKWIASVFESVNRSTTELWAKTTTTNIIRDCVTYCGFDNQPNTEMLRMYFLCGNQLVGQFKHPLMIFNLCYAINKRELAKYKQLEDYIVKQLSLPKTTNDNENSIIDIAMSDQIKHFVANVSDSSCYTQIVRLKDKYRFQIKNSINKPKTNIVRIEKKIGKYKHSFEIKFENDFENLVWNVTIRSSIGRSTIQRVVFDVQWEDEFIDDDNNGDYRYLEDQIRDEVLIVLKDFENHVIQSLHNK